tara:strand:+ start:24 stop:962 length:939 start_codon:yes stop_codon:yes gene_type:complete
MNIKPFENTNLYGLDDYHNEIINLYLKKKLPNKILFSGKKGSGKSTLAYHILNFIFSASEENKYDLDNKHININNKSFILVKNNTHPNFYLIDLIDEKKNIDVNQIREMIKYSNKSSFNNLPRFILIDNIENLNKNSVNALLKIVEEPNENLFFILIHNSEKNILPTLRSRCIIFKINLSYDTCVNIVNLIIGKNINQLINPELLNQYSTPGELINLINFAEEKKINLNNYSLNDLIILIIDNNYYKKNILVKDLLINFIELFFLREFKLSTTKNSLLEVYQYFLNKLNDNNKFNLDEENMFLEFKSKLLNG